MIDVSTPYISYALVTPRDTTQTKPLVSLSPDDPNVTVGPFSEALAEESSDWLADVTKKPSQSRPSKSLSKEKQAAKEEGLDGKPKVRKRGFFKRLLGLR